MPKESRSKSSRSKSSQAVGISSNVSHRSREDTGNSPYQSSLRAAESRFSLTDQFATTRREFEFGFDDASSIFTKVTDIEPVEDFTDEDITEVSRHEAEREPEEKEEAFEYSAVDYYDLLCLPKDETLTQKQIRNAFYRNFLMLYPEMHSGKYQAMATTHFLKMQTAYETLMDPVRRAEYDLFGEAGESPEIAIYRNYEAAVEDKLRAKMQQVVYGSSEVGVRVDGSRLYKKLASGKVVSKKGVDFKAFDKEIGVRPLDYALSQSMTVPVLVHKVLPLASLASARDKITSLIPALLFRKTDSKGREKPLPVPPKEYTYYFATPTVTIAGSLYGLVSAPSHSTVNSALLTDRFQPLLPLTISRHRIPRLAELRCTPFVAVRVRQELITKVRDNQWIKKAVEIETDVLPESCLTVRTSQTFIPLYSVIPWNMEASVTNGHSGVRRIALGIYRPVGPGSAFIRVDSGDWKFNNAEVCNLFGQFVKESRKWFFTYFQFPSKTTPSIELGYKTTPCERWSVTNYPDIPRGESGIRGMDREASFVGNGSWAVSASAMPGERYSGYLRYSRDLPLLLSAQMPSRVEVELCGNSMTDHFIALRNLWQVGRFSRLGLEVGISASHFHLSLYWSRLSQAMSVPLLISPRASMDEKVVFWTAVAPFVSVAAMQMVTNWFWSRGMKAKAKVKVNSEKLAAYVAEKRYEAEDFESLVESHVENRQKREAKKGGLVILSAKYGVRKGEGRDASWESEVADVRLAVASLVDRDGRLEIPKGVRKSHIPGFWDPMPLKDKVLVIRWQYRGKDGIVEVHGWEGVVLPPLGF